MRARVHDDRAGAVVLGLLPNMGVAGSGLLSLSQGQGGTGHRKLQFLLACAAVLVASLILTLCSPSGDGPFVASSVTSGLALLASFAALLRNWTPAEIAALRTPVAVGALAFLPGVSLRFARLPIGFEMPDTAPRSTYATTPGPTSRSTPSASGLRPGAAMNSSSAWPAAVRRWRRARPWCSLSPAGSGRSCWPSPRAWPR
ncbi:hypothetical protein GCM10010287_64350 [Streptomyces variabilis]|uniref:EccD-like transmembrane domain-containing protein n=1 Tax=Streptomyces variabilis TaxID=67372 RepID=A0ABQ2U9Y5_9ACTN|nr:hypothetical protein GCM10010265_63930 [Streptomyces griseoincarnatus]GGT81059.1 hypothetical protein GCM10010287_64350 [Streptomyces variabilis]